MLPFRPRLLPLRNILHHNNHLPHHQHGHLPSLTTTTTSIRTLTTTLPLHGPKPLPPRPKIDEAEITEAFLKGTGPGGQKINKTSSAVQLKHLPTGIVIKCQETRSRSQNRKIARRILSERIEDLELGEGSRQKVKIERVKVKKASRDKKARRKYRKLAEGEVGVGNGEDGEGIEGVEDGEGDGDEGAVKGRAGEDSSAVVDETVESPGSANVVAPQSKQAGDQG